MISYLKGSILSKNSKSLVLLVGNIGYQIFAPTTLLQKAQINSELELYTHLRHSEDAMSLFGFETQEELRFFEILITISGVGPKTALGVLEVAKLSDIKKAILRDDPAILYKVSGIGKKTAERIVVELKNKLDVLPATEKELNLSDTDTETFDALISLGYNERDVREALKKIPPDIIRMEDKLKNAFKYLSK
ncbi:Holliday junction branch migration protein RuvA [Candidatus Kuenenbacteria bacterium]|nr:Holliday junction branch migration protein RuvA [Candidatus Kuenenbacteria bacterium]